MSLSGCENKKYILFVAMGTSYKRLEFGFNKFLGGFFFYYKLFYFIQSVENNDMNIVVRDNYRFLLQVSQI